MRTQELNEQHIHDEARLPFHPLYPNSTHLGQHTTIVIENTPPIPDEQTSKENADISSKLTSNDSSILNIQATSSPELIPDLDNNPNQLGIIDKDIPLDIPTETQPSHVINNKSSSENENIGGIISSINESIPVEKSVIERKVYTLITTYIPTGKKETATLSSLNSIAVETLINVIYKRYYNT